MVVGDLTDLAEGVEGPGVDVAGLCTHDGRSVTEGVAQRRRAHPALIVGWHCGDVPLAKSQKAQRPIHGGVPFLTHHDGDLRGPEQTLGIDIPPRCGQDMTHSHRKSREVGHLSPRGEPGRGGLR
jgi:hypothetical protein